MTAQEIRNAYLEFARENGHVIIPRANLVPQNDPTTLFTGSGMQPLITYLLGEPHPSGTRVADSQTCLRAEDIEEVGDNRHTTFFEMLGNWSFGDYFKKEQLTWYFTFLTEIVGIDPNKLYVTAFLGDDEAGVPKDEESATLWQDLFKQKNIDAKIVEVGSEADGYVKGMQGGRIFYYDAKKNWWSRAGVPANMPAGEPGGPGYVVSARTIAPKCLNNPGGHGVGPLRMPCQMRSTTQPITAIAAHFSTSKNRFISDALSFRRAAICFSCQSLCRLGSSSGNASFEMDAIPSFTASAMTCFSDSICSLMSFCSSICRR
jgi:hypothetical protein